MNLTPLRAVFGSDSLRAGQVASWLQVGPALDGPGYRRLRLQGVTHVVDLRDECCDDPDEMDALGIRWRRLPIVERQAPTLRQLNDLMAWLEAEADEMPDALLYLHGAAGRGRTTTVAIALLMHQEMTFEQAQRQVLRAWPVVAPSAAQRAFLDEVTTRLSCESSVVDLRASGDG
ncbi:MAG: hypothetical protein FJ037_08370 [Chloroflexi bacterium]|nr:hypothetical protein [Chloroflexota bacterium]